MISEPERSAASTTIVALASPAMIRLRAGKHQRVRHEARAASPRRRRRVRRSGRGARACSAGRRRRRRRRAPRPSARRPQRAGVRRAVDAERHARSPRSRRPRPARAPASARPRGRRRDARRVPTTRGGRARPRSAPRAPSRRDPAGHEQHRRRVVEVAQAPRIAGAWRQTTSSPAASTRRAARGVGRRSLARCARRARRRAAREILVGQREHLAQAPALVARELDRARRAAR